MWISTRQLAQSLS